MRVSEAWLREWVTTPLTVSEISHRLTMAGLEVGQIEPVAGAFSGVVVARVCSTAPHPKADRLTVCEVEVAPHTTYQVVCGAANVRAGLRVALALPGAELPGNVSIRESTLRGELSQGMLCSAQELGLSEAFEGILELAHDAPLGTSLRTYLDLDDQVLEIDLTPNRADCLSVRGIARELSALTQLPWGTALPALPVQSAVHVTDSITCPSVSLSVPDACPVYCVRMLRGIRTDATTPVWMKERLRRGGLSSVHPVVDALNYVMLDMGQPMHAYDAASVSGALSVRRAHVDESLTLLNGRTVLCRAEMLVVADTEAPLALAGIMGGARCAVQAETRDVILESAYFNPVAIATTARSLHVSSDASIRFERGVDSSMPRVALERVTELLVAMVGGEVGPVVVIEQRDALPTPAVILFRPESVLRITGLGIADTVMKTILTGLGLMLEDIGSVWRVTIPLHRFDLRNEVDLVEEVLRVYGYDQLHEVPVMATLKLGALAPMQQRLRDVGGCLVQRGYREAISYSFVEPTLQRALYPDEPVMTLVNPISSEMSEMRLGMWPGLLATYVHNSHRQQTQIKCFETGTVFSGTDDALQEHTAVGGILVGQEGACHWGVPTRAYDFYDVKGDVEALCHSLRLFGVQYVAAQHPALHPGQSAQIRYQQRAIGWLGLLHPRIAHALDLTAPVFLFELQLDACVVPSKAVYRRVSKYPKIRRDLCLLVDLAIEVAAIEAVLRAVIPAAQLNDLRVFDHYTGEALPVGKKSIAIALTLQDEHRTLVDDEVNGLIARVLEQLNTQLAIALRD